MPFEMNMLIMHHVHHLCTEMKGKTYITAQSTPKYTNQASII